MRTLEETLRVWLQRNRPSYPPSDWTTTDIELNYRDSELGIYVLMTTG